MTDFQLSEYTSGEPLRLHLAELRRDVDFTDAVAIGRGDQQFFWAYFLGRLAHPGQLSYVTGAEATINVLACSNRYGKTTLLAGRHFHRCIYKVGGEPNYVDEDGVFQADAFRKLKYRTIHAAGEWEQAKHVWEDMHRLIDENPPLEAFVVDRPRSMPPHITFAGGGRTLFRTLGVGSSGIDGDSFYYISIDEAGWIDSLEKMMSNVLRVRVADVRGIIDIVGTFKPGVSKDFYKYAVRAAASTGAGIAFDHRGADDTEPGLGLDASIVKYAHEMGFDLAAERARLAEEHGS